MDKQLHKGQFLIQYQDYTFCQLIELRVGFQKCRNMYGYIHSRLCIHKFEHCLECLQRVMVMLLKKKQKADNKTLIKNVFVFIKSS